MIGRDIVEDNAPDTGISLMCADEDGTHSEIEPVDRDSVTEEKKTEVTKGTRVEGVDVFAFGETTSAVTTFAPPSDTPAKPAETDIVLEAAMRKDARSLNLSNCVAIGAYECMRQVGFFDLSDRETLKGAEFLLRC